MTLRIRFASCVGIAILTLFAACAPDELTDEGPTTGQPDLAAAGDTAAPAATGVPGDTTWPVIANVEVLDALNAQQLRQGLGFQVVPGNLWELQVAKDIGAAEVRFQTSWDYIEKSPGTRALDPRHANALAEAARLGLEVQAVAAYGPGWTTPMALTVASNVGTGQTTIPVRESVAGIIPFRDHARRSDGNMLVQNGRWSYAGAMVAGKWGNAIVLGSPLAASLAAGQRININRRAYAPPADANNPNDPSVLAYRDYLLFLAGEMHKRGVKGHVELWNEPPWDHDRWDGGRGCFTNGAGCQWGMRGMASLLATLPAPDGVGWNWAGPHKTGVSSVFWTGSSTGAKPTAGSDFDQESIHPYGGSPEWGGWNPHCLRTRLLILSMSCVWVGMNQYANHKVAFKYSLDHAKATGHRIRYTITEHGALMSNREAQSRYFLRSFFHYLGAGVHRVSFYRLAGDNTWGIVDGGTRAFYPAARALQAMMQDLNPLTSQTPDRTQGRPAVIGYSGGQWPLHVAPVLGRKAGSSANSYWLVVWQRTYPDRNWANIPRPNGANVTLRLPPGYRIVGATELTRRANLPVSGSVVSGVRDEPVAIRVEL